LEIDSGLKREVQFFFGANFNVDAPVFAPQAGDVMPGVRDTMEEFKKGLLRSGSKKGPVVTKRKPAIAIALNQAKK
jgi:hypothetical protein